MFDSGLRAWTAIPEPDILDRVSLFNLTLLYTMAGMVTKIDTKRVAPIPENQNRSTQWPDRQCLASDEPG
jgi:hypothetical protein